VQAELQRGLSLLLKHDVDVVGAGRTDAGVHARQMAAHFDSDVDFSTRDLAYKLNRLLPHDIAIDRIEPVPADMHARFSATSRTYHYHVHLRKDPFLWDYSYKPHFEPDFALMNEAAATLLEYDDFGAFCKAGSDVKTTLCRVTHAQWHQTSDYTWYFEITANRFLRNMVRAVVGTLLEVGRHRMTVAEFRSVVEGRKRTQAGESMPGHALYLQEVKY
ncbi:MAG: tRNA pseudouridine(38-40) synthase TruA, partial [Prevotella sp.]|nr:tRNA pseudouridine(38-40) synthase TruA [Prevotella sp.]